MAKILLVVDATNLSDKKPGQVLGVYDDSSFIKTKDEIINLPDWRYLEQALFSGDEKIINAAKLSLVQKFCTDEQRLILMNIFELVVKEGTLNDIQAEQNRAIPEMKMMWIDPETEEAKELTEVPTSQTKFVDGKFQHTFNDIESNTKVLNAEIKPDTKIG